MKQGTEAGATGLFVLDGADGVGVFAAAVGDAGSKDVEEVGPQLTVSALGGPERISHVAGTHP